MLLRDPMAIILLVGLVLPGCATPPAQDRVTLAAAHYDDAFDAAVETIRSHGWDLAIMDRRGGVIESEPRQSPSVLEPWALQTTDPDLAMLATLGDTTRRVRIEFSPAGPLPLADNADAQVPEADVLGLDLDEDLTTRTGDIDTRVWVWVERTYRPGRRLGTWTFQEDSWATEATEDPIWATSPKRVAVPEGRDRGAERLLLAEVTQRLAN